MLAIQNCCKNGDKLGAIQREIIYLFYISTGKKSKLKMLTVTCLQTTPARSFIISLSLTSPGYSLSWNNSYFSLVFIVTFCGSFVTVSVSGDCLAFYEHGTYLPFISSVISSYVNKFVEKMSPFSNKLLKGSTGNYDNAYQQGNNALPNSLHVNSQDSFPLDIL